MFKQPGALQGDIGEVDIWMKNRGVLQEMVCSKDKKVIVAVSLSFQMRQYQTPMSYNSDYRAPSIE